MKQPSKFSFLQMIKIMLSWKMMVMFFFGFSSGFPYYIIKDVLKFWMMDANVDIAKIGLFALVGMPYTLKFVWSPMMDGFVPPFLGRRRGWILMAQIGLMITIAVLGQFDPKQSLMWIAVFALCLNFFGASQDIALDAFRREYLTSDELGFGTGVWMNAWRLGTFVSVGLSVLADFNFTWSTIFFMLTAVMGVGIITTLLVPEPEVEDPLPVNMKEAVAEPFIEFFQRRRAILILLFILLYKIGDNMASTMTIPYIVQMGFTKAQYFVIVKGVGMLGLFGGVLVGGSIMIRLGIAKSLYVFGILQAISTAFFAVLNMIDHGSYFWIEHSRTLLGSIVAFEFFATGMGQAAYATYMAIQTNKRFTATQYALLTSLMGVPGVFAASLTGYMSIYLGWNMFYYLCAVVAIPGMLLLFKIAPWTASNEVLEEGR
ncbi:MAG: MFS transporter [Desulfobacula sp.]|nr:MFS transporter [Desulfobacula sp.]